MFWQYLDSEGVCESPDSNFGWRVVHNCKTKNSDDIYITTKKTKQKPSKKITTHFFVPVEQDLETQATNTLKNQMIIKIPKYP